MNEVRSTIDYVEGEVIGKLETAVDNMKKLLNEYNGNHKDKLQVVSVNNKPNNDGTYSFEAIDKYHNRFQLDVPAFLDNEYQLCITQLD